MIDLPKSIEGWAEQVGGRLIREASTPNDGWVVSFSAWYPQNASTITKWSFYFSDWNTATSFKVKLFEGYSDPSFWEPYKMCEVLFQASADFSGPDNV